jgi:uncharacterized protein (TIGR02266 family)
MAKVSMQVDDAEERRRADRADLTIRVEYSTVDQIFSEFTRDINEGGLFIETDDPRPVGTEVSMQFTLPCAEIEVNTVGLVVRTSDGTEGRPAGMGVEFDDLTGEARSQINEIVQTLRTGAGPTSIKGLD